MLDLMPAVDEPALPPAHLVAGESDDALAFDLDAEHEPRPVANDDDDIHLLKDAEDPDRFAWRARIRDNPVTLFWWRIAVGVAGAVLMIAAALTGWLPGPGGIPLFLLGLAVWASEFDWAHGVLLYFKRWFDRLQALTPRQRKIFWTLVVVGILVTWYGAAAIFGLPGWVPEPLAGWIDSLPLVEPAK